MNSEVNENLFIGYIKLKPKYVNLKAWSKETYKLIKEHSAYLNKLGEDGILLFAGRTKLDPEDENLFGIMVFKAPSSEKAKELVSKDPAVSNQIQKIDVFPFSLGIQYFQNIASEEKVNKP